MMNQQPITPTQKAQNVRICMVPVNPDVFRFARPHDKLHVELTTDARQYVIVNTGFQHSTRNTVTFKVSATGTKLASCTCQDFAAIRYHERQCKHIHMAYNFHVARMAMVARIASPAKDGAACI